mmetsp:Transcript_105858/g.165218  ORF Transcript_105858/g.165218 Transcript_105858/m.165218 type:complete len:203 (+) Transcript_105858:68-676(+)|eukprot:CAMPEP_0169110182 /NCGR_PEP_ID=MMETSP1015-20121227/26373_1 /TAXON_ID=342587 /ORGANISM="Karlodinium micrum, Strain CCMP2283" /LENGTH=202 /DNA_ID=CAMNT_0009171951 /DNA_START=71 /DNA_END=679 /DNA_ORIENTATION=+
MTGEGRYDFGVSLRGKSCCVCKKWILNRGCRLCKAKFCQKHFVEHSCISDATQLVSSLPMEDDARLKAAGDVRQKEKDEARLECEKDTRKTEEAKCKKEEHSRLKAAEESRQNAADEAELKAAADAKKSVEDQAKQKLANDAKLQEELMLKARQAAKEATLKVETDATNTETIASKEKDRTPSDSEEPELVPIMPYSRFLAK